MAFRLRAKRALIAARKRDHACAHSSAQYIDSLYLTLRKCCAVHQRALIFIYVEKRAARLNKACNWLGNANAARSGLSLRACLSIRIYIEGMMKRLQQGRANLHEVRYVFFLCTGVFEASSIA